MTCPKQSVKTKNISQEVLQKVNTISQANMIELIDSVIGRQAKRFLGKGPLNTTDRKVFQAIVTLAAATFVVQIFLVGRELFVAAKFGTSDAMDAFLIAYLLPSFIVSVIAGSFTSAVVPAFVQARDHEGAKAAQKLLSSVTVCGLVLLTLASILLWLLAPLYLPWIASGFSNEKLALTNGLLVALLPIVLLSGLVNIWSAVLNASERFGLAGLVPAIPPLAMIVSLVALGEAIGIYSLALGYLIGSLIQVIILGVALRRLGIQIGLQWHGIDHHIRSVASQYLPMVAGAFLLSGSGLVDQSIAAMLDPGSVAALSYGSKVVTLVLGFGGVTIGTAMLPYFSQQVAASDWAGLRKTLDSYLRLIFIVTVPTTLLMILGSEPIVGILFERGAFTAQDTRLVAKIQSFLALQIPFYVAGMLPVRLISALKQNSVLLQSAAISLALGITMDIAMANLMGVAGIALSRAIVYLVSFLYLLVNARMALYKASSGG